MDMTSHPIKSRYGLNEARLEGGGWRVSETNFASHLSMGAIMSWDVGGPGGICEIEAEDAKLMCLSIFCQIRLHSCNILIQVY